MNFSERLMELRSRRRMTQGDLAERLGVSRQSVSKWENGESFPDLPKLVQLADALGVSLDDLCGREKAEDGAGGADTTDGVESPEGEDQNGSVRPHKGQEGPQDQLDGNKPAKGKKKRLLGLLLLLTCLLAGGVGGYFIGTAISDSRQEIVSRKLPELLRVTSQTIICNESALACRFHVNYYSSSAKYKVALIDANGEISQVPSIKQNGDGWVEFSTKDLPLLTAMKMELSVQEGDMEKTVPIATKILVAQSYKNGYEVSYITEE